MRRSRPLDTVLQLLLALLFIVPLVIAFKGSGGFSDAFGAWQPAGDSLLSARQWTLVAACLRSFCIAILCVVFTIVPGIAAGWTLARAHNPLWLLVLTALPLALPASVAVSGWVHLLAPLAISSFAMPYFISSKGLAAALFSPCGTAAVLAGCFWPIVALETWPAFKRARNEAYDAALMSNSRTCAFLRVVLPQARGELASGAMLVFILASSDFSVSSLLLQHTLSVEIHDALIGGKTASAAWSSLPLILMSLVVAAVLALRRRDQTDGATGLSISEDRQGRLPVSLLWTGIFFGFAIPMAACLHGALHGRHAMSHVFGAGSDALGISIRLCAAAAVFSVLVGIARVLVWPRSRAWPLNAAGLFLLAVPGSFLAASLFSAQLGLAALFKEPITALPAIVLSLGYVIRFLYLPLRLVEEGLAGLDSEMFDAAALAGHRRAGQAISIALPLVTPHLVAAAALMFILSLGEVPISDRLHSPGITPATIWLFQQQHLGYDESVFGLSLLLGVVVALVLLVGGLLSAVLIRQFHRAPFARI